MGCLGTHIWVPTDSSCLCSEVREGRGLTSPKNNCPACLKKSSETSGMCVKGRGPQHPSALTVVCWKDRESRPGMGASFPRTWSQRSALTWSASVTAEFSDKDKSHELPVGNNIKVCLVGLTYEKVMVMGSRSRNLVGSWRI